MRESIRPLRALADSVWRVEQQRCAARRRPAAGPTAAGAAGAVLTPSDHTRKYLNPCLVQYGGRGHNAISMLAPALAVVVPPHARVNSQCWPVWNEDRSDLRLVWRGTTHSHSFHAFATQPSTGACTANGCVQRLWCTDTGAAGWYGNGGDTNVPLAAAWLLSPNTTYSRTLSAVEGSATMKYTSVYGPGTLVVAGSTLYFYTFSSGTAQGLPRLSSLVFAEWRSGASGASLVSDGLVSYNVLGYSGSYYWFSIASPLYPSGAGAVTLSVEDYHGNGAEYANKWAIDAVVNNGARGALVHYLRADCPSVASASREVATFPGYSCRAFVNGTVQCAAVEAGGRYTWASASQRVSSLGMRFAPLDPFTVPGNPWLHAGIATIELYDTFTYAALVGFGHAPALGVAGDVLAAVETRADAGCPSGSRLHLVHRALPGGVETAAEALGCEWRQVAPMADYFEPAYVALAVKWAGVWMEGPLFTAVSLADEVYHLRGARETQVGDPSTEHVAWNDSGAVVTLHTANGLLRCPALGLSGVPTDIAIAVGSARENHVLCVRALVPTRVAPDTMYDRCPLFVQSIANGDIAKELLAAGADPNAKCANTSTLLMQALGNPGVAGYLLRAGAAVCTWPRSVRNIRHQRDGWRGARARVLAVASTAPCEPGFWLAPGKFCTGLTVCAPGNYCPGYRERTNMAMPCPPGTFGPLSGTVSVA